MVLLDWKKQLLFSALKQGCATRVTIIGSENGVIVPSPRTDLDMAVHVALISLQQVCIQFPPASSAI